MSYLIRTGTAWIDINSNGTYNVLERTSTGRNNIRWYNTQFSFTVNISDYFKGIDSLRYTRGKNNDMQNRYIYNSPQMSGNALYFGGIDMVDRVLGTVTDRLTIMHRNNTTTEESDIEFGTKFTKFQFTGTNSSENDEVYTNTLKDIRNSNGTETTIIFNEAREYSIGSNENRSCKPNAKSWAYFI